MRIPADGKLLRIFIGEQDKWKGKPLYEAIVELARKEGMAGATALKGLMGFGAKSHMHTAKILRLSEDLPILIEIVGYDIELLWKALICITIGVIDRYIVLDGRLIGQNPKIILVQSA